MAVIGSVLVATNQVDFHYMIKIVEDKYKIWAWVGVMYSIIIMPLSMIFLNYFLGIKNIKENLNKYINSPININIGTNLSNIILGSATILSIIVIYYVFQANNHVPLFTLIKGDLHQAAIERIEVRREFGGIIYIKNLLGLILMPVFSYYSFILWREKKGIIKFIFFIILNILTILLLAYDTQKSPVVFFIFGYLILFTFLTRGISIRKFLLFICIGILLITTAYSITGGRGIEQLLDIKSAFYGRLFVSGYGGYVLSLKLFPDIITQSTWYIGIPEAFLNFFNLENTESARLLMMHINPEGVAEGTSNLVSSYYLGEAYANYGILGLLIAPIVVGFVIQIVHILLLKNKKDPLFLSFYAFITVRWLLNAGFVSFLYLKIILYPLFFLLLIKLIINTIPNKKQNKIK